MIPPGGTIGILGGGQLGRMLVLAGRAMGYRFHVFEPKPGSSAGMVADAETNAGYDDAEALRAFAASVDAVTLEFENIPVDAIQTVARQVPVRPGARALHICQHRQREKEFLRENGFPHAPFRYAGTADELSASIGEAGFPCVVKTAAFGYDGKGQILIETEADAADPENLLERLGRPPRVVVENWIRHRGEFSVICARNEAGAASTLPMAENEHRHHILHASLVPARVPDGVRGEGERLARAIADALDVVGLIAVEFFLDPEGRLLVNEMAPRPHNSGHYSIDACATSQFEQHIRAITGLPFGATDLLRPVVMTNLLGDLWSGGTPDWAGLLADPRTHLHLYDKGEPRPGRKMGHFTVLDDEPAEALRVAEAAFASLEGRSTSSGG